MAQKTSYSSGSMKKQTPKVFVTSDTFFGRGKTARERGFSSAEDMNVEMIERWNSKVGKTDAVIHLGNFAWSPSDVDEILPRLNGVIVFMLADHDQAILAASDVDESINILEDQIVTQDGVVLCHWPLEVWPGKDNKKYHFHGHTKPNVKTDITKMLRVNVGCDNWSLAPVELNDTIELLKDFQ